VLAHCIFLHNNSQREAELFTNRLYISWKKKTFNTKEKAAAAFV